MSEYDLNDHIYKHVCEVCGKVEYLTPREAYKKGWDYPPISGKFGIISPRTCPNCIVDDTVWAKIVLDDLQFKDLTRREMKTIIRILNEPKSIEVKENEIYDISVKK